MPDQLQLRGGTTTEHNSFTGVSKEVTVDTTKKTLVVHDGSQAGGTPLMKESGGNAASSVGIGTGGTNAININSNQKVGIGITSNVAPFSVKTETDGIFHIRPIGAIASGPAGSGVGLDVLNDAGSAVKDLAVRGSTTIFRNASSESLRIDSSGNVGIGTTSPATKLTVNAGSTNSAIAIFTGNDANRGLKVSTATENSQTDMLVELEAHGQHSSAYEGEISLKTGGAHRLRVDKAGNVGIGTTSPNYNLVVQGSGSQAVLVGSTNAASATIIIDGDSNGDGSGSDYASISHTTDGNIEINNRKSAAIVFKNTSSETERMRITSAGNVGIGTTSPTNKLHVAQGSTGQLIKVVTNNNNTRAQIECAGKTSDGTVVRCVLGGDGDVGGNLFTASNHKLQFGTNNSAPQMTLDTTGKLGIGTTGPNGYNANASDIVINRSGNAGITISTGTTSIGRIAFGDNDDNNIGQIRYAHSENNMLFDVNAAERMRIASNGKVGIGLTDPDQKLEVDGIIKGSSYFQGGASATAGNNFHFGAEGDGTFRIYKGNYGAGSEQFRINSSGNVGIGTSNPGQRLEVRQTAASHAIIACNRPNSDTFAVALGNNSSNNGVISVNNSDLLFGRDSSGTFTERMRMTNDGDVGIGTTSPSRKLEVTDASFSAIRIKNSSTSIANGTNIAGIEFEHADSSAAGVGAGILAEMADTSTGGLNMIFKTGTGVSTYQESMRIGSSGKLFIGTTSGGDTAAAVRAKHNLGVDSSYTDFLHAPYEAQITINSGGENKKVALLNGWDGGLHGVSIGMMYDGGYNMIFGVNNDTNDRPTQRAFLGKTGQFIVGPNTTIGGSAHGVRLQSPDVGTSRFASQGTGNITYIQFINNGSILGSISGGSSSTSYNTSSDYRLKENETAITNGITRLKQLKPYRFNWKSDSSTIVDGFFAHEVSSVVPESITGTKDAVAVEDDVNKGLAEAIGDPIYQNIDQSKLVPLLVAAVKELIGRVETLEAA